MSSPNRPIPTADSSNVLIKKSRISDIRFIKQKNESGSANSKKKTKIRHFLKSMTTLHCSYRPRTKEPSIKPLHLTSGSEAKI